MVQRGELYKKGLTGIDNSCSLILNTNSRGGYAEAMIFYDDAMKNLHGKGSIAISEYSSLEPIKLLSESEIELVMLRYQEMVDGMTKPKVRQRKGKGKSESEIVNEN